jgi:type VI protein secretion system component Hcp
MSEEYTEIYKSMKKCFDKDMSVFEDYKIVTEDNEDYLEIKLNDEFLSDVKSKIGKDESYINLCMQNIVINDLTHMISENEKG